MGYQEDLQAQMNRIMQNKQTTQQNNSKELYNAQLQEQINRIRGVAQPTQPVATQPAPTQPIGQYGAGNINLYNRPIVNNPDGTTSTVRSMSFSDGKNEILIPTVVNGKVVSDDEAIDNYYKTGEYLGKFNTVDEANAYAENLHKQQEKLYSKSQKNQMTTTLPNSLNIKNNIVQQANNAMPSFQDFQVEYNKGKNEANKELNQKGNELKGRDIENYDKLLTKAEAEHNTKDTVKYTKLKEEAEKQVKEKSKTASADDYDLDFTKQSNNINVLGNELQRNAKLYEDMSNLGASQEELNKIANNYQTALNEYNEALNKYYDNQYYDKYKNNNMFRDIAESFGKNVLGGTAAPINFGAAATSKLVGNDATTINAEQLLQYNNGQGFNGKDVERILGGIIPSPMSIINNATGRNEGPATAYAHLALLAQTHPNSRKLQNLLSAISNHSYTGTAEDLKKDLDEAQKEMYQDFKNRTTQDDLNRVAEQTAHNERTYENMAWIPNAFGTVGNMVPSMLVGGAAGGIAELAGGGSMAVAGTTANTLQRVGSLGSLGLGAGGSAMDEAIRNGATYNQGMAYGALKGATEAGTEVLGGETVNKAFGQVGESVLGKVFGKAIGKLNIKSAIGKKLAKIGTDIAGEMTEEMIAEAVDPLWRQLTYDNGAIKDYGTLEQWKNVFKAGLEAIPSTLIMQGGNVVLNKTSQLENGIIKSIQASDNLSPESKQALIQQVQEASKQMVQEINAQEQNNQIARDAETLNLQPAQNNAQITSQNATIASKVAELNKRGFNIPQSTANTLQAIQDVRGTRIEFDNTVDGNGVYDAKNRIIYLNPSKASRAIEFTIAHELGHDIKAGNLEDYKKLQKAVLDYARKQKGFTEGMQALDNTYRNFQEKQRANGQKFEYDIDDEMTNDILGEVLGNQEFLDSLAKEQPKTFERIWNWIKNVLIDNTNGRLSFNERRLLNKYEQGFRNAYQKAFNGTQQKGMQYSIQERSDGSKYVLVDTDQNIFDGIDKKDYNKIAEMYITDYLLGNTTLSKNDIAEIDKLSSRKYTHPGKYQAKFNEKMRLTPELKNVLEIAQLTKARTKADKPNAAYPYYEYYTFDFELGGKEFTAQLNIGIDSKGNKHLYEINRIHPAVQGTIPNQSAKVYSNNIVPPTQHNVNNQHSLSEETNDTQNRMKKLNDDLDLTWRTRDSLYDRRDELEKQYNDTINSEDYKNAFEQVKAFDNAEDAMNSEAYKKLVEAQRIKDSIRDLQDEIDIATADMRRMQEEINNLENEDRTPEKAIKQAKKIFGTTTDFKEAGYILQDGKMLDFSGRKQGNTTSGRRALDHRQINEVGYDMDEFIGLGNIRLQPEGNGFQLMVEPTDQQYKMLEKFINQANGEIYIDIYKDGKMANPDSTEYTKNTPTSKIIDDLRQYFKKGKFPTKSQYSNFLYSISDEANENGGFREANPVVTTVNSDAVQELAKKYDMSYYFIEANIGKTPKYAKSFLESQLLNGYMKEHNLTDSLATRDSQEYKDFLDEVSNNLFEKNQYDQDEVMDEAIFNSGTTDDYSVGAYMTTDGQLLDFDDGGGYRDDHRTLDVFDMDMQDFMDYGAIRMMPESNGFEIAIEPTQAQYERLADYIDEYVKNNAREDDTILVDIDTEGSGYISKDYSLRTPTSKIINDIKTYFETGEYPNTQYMYQKNNNTWQQFLDNTYGKWNTGTRTNFEQLPSNEELQQAERESIENEPLTKMSTTNSLENMRDFKGVGNRKINAYQYDNPEVKPFFQHEARNMLQDLNNAVKGEKSATWNDYGELRYTGTSRETTQDIADLLDGNNGVKLSYEDIRKGLNAIIEDKGSENIAAAKRIEMVLDKRLREGYTDSYGDSYEPNENYLNFLAGKDFIDPAEYEKQVAEKMATEDGTLFSLSEEQQNEVNDYISKLNNDTTIDDNFKDQILTRFDNLTDYKQFENIKQDVEDYKEKAYQGIKSLVDVANMKPEDVKQRPMEYTQRKDKNTPNQRRFFDNMETSNIIADETKNRVNATTYEQKANLDTLEQVRQKLDERGNDMVEEWKHKTKNFTDKDVALGAILIERYQQAGDWGSAARAVEKLADMGTEAGRAVQMYSIFQRLSPETMALYQQKALDKAFEEMKQRKTGKWVEANQDKYKLTAEDTQFIYEQVEKASQAIDEETKQRELSKIENRINDKLPPEDGQTIKALRRIAMLFNPKTQVRNIVGNTLIMPVNDIADVIGAGIDRIVARKTGTRTTGLPNPITKAKGFAKGVKSAITDYKTGTRTTGSGSKYEFDIGAKPFNENTDSKVKNAINNKLNGINNLLSAVMSGGDRPFYEAAYKNSLESQMKANKVKEPTQDMIDIAVNEALQRTWNDNNEYTKAVLGIRSAMNKINIKGFGLGDLIVPFAKTPANLTKAMVEYSPAGFIPAISNYVDMSRAISRGEMTPQQQKKFVSSMSKAIAGSILYAIAGSLVKAGKITGSADDDKDVRNFEQNVLGIQPYSVRLGDKTYTYSWANPINAPLAIMADSYKMSKEDAKLYDQLYNAIKVAGNVLLDNSFLQGISDIFTHQEGPVAGIIESIMSMPESMIPTFLSQIASLGDDTQRQTYEYKNKGQSVINRVKNKIPGARNTLEPKVNTFGEEIENQNNLFNAFLNPANVREARTTEAQKEIYSLYEATGDKTIFPMQAPNSVTKNGENTNLTNAQKNRYQKGSGQYATEVYGDLFDSDYYDSINNTQKTDLLQRVAQDANKMGKTEVGVWTEDTFKVDERYNELEDMGIPLADYYIAWSAQKDVVSDKDANGKTITLSASKKKKEAIDDAVDNLNKKQMEYLYGIFDISEKVW